MNPAYPLTDPAYRLQPRARLLPRAHPPQHRAGDRDGRLARAPAAARQDAQDPRDRPDAARRGRHEAQVRHHRRGRDARRRGAPDVLIAYPLVGPEPRPAGGTHPQVPQDRLLVAHRRCRRDASALGRDGQGRADESAWSSTSTSASTAPACRWATRRSRSTNSPRRSPASRPTASRLYDGHNNQPDRAEREAAVRDVHRSRCSTSARRPRRRAFPCRA